MLITHHSIGLSDAGLDSWIPMLNASRLDHPMLHGPRVLRGILRRISVNDIGLLQVQS